MTRRRALAALRATATRAAPPPPEPAELYGLDKHQRERPDVAVENRPHPTLPNTTVRGTRRVGIVDRLHAEGVLSIAHLRAAREYARLAEEIALGLTADPDRAAGRTHPAHRTHAPEAIAQANAKLARAASLVGLQGEIVLRAVCVAGRPLEAVYGLLWPRAGHVHRATAIARVSGVLVAALDRLAQEGWA